MVPLLVVAAIVTFLLVDLLVQRLRTAKGREKGAPVPAREVSPDALQWNVRVPEGIFLSKGHSWAILEPAGSVRVGMDDFARQMIGPIDALDLPSLGTRVRAGEPIVTLYKDASLARITSPVDGTVSEVHADLAIHTAPATKDPYGEGWMLEVKPDNLSSNLRNLTVAGDASAFLKKEVERFRDFITVRHPQVALAADGGQPIPGIAAALGPQAWEDFRREFLAENL